IVGVDFSEEMLKIAGNKQRKKQSENQLKNQTDRYKPPVVKWLCADAESVPLPGEQFDCVTCAFGIRNIQNLQTALREMFRLLKPRGRLVILEFALPRNRLLSALYECYFRLVLPCLGGIISNDKYGAYRYLPNSVISFPNAHKLKCLIKQADFSTVRVECLCWGVVLAIVADK
ncbi:MAG: class I SAM-dependent methyltransferase, partial [Sedimentisphaerales bacterium]|nr:class I SAM-dependent methyltransferase [Sedimentisphaerales bacterium]